MKWDKLAEAALEGVARATKAWDQSRGNIDLLTFLTGRIGEGRANRVLETLGKIDEAQQDLREAKGQGNTRAGFLANAIEAEGIERLVVHQQGGGSEEVSASGFADWLVRELAEAGNALFGEAGSSIEFESPPLPSAQGFFEGPLGDENEVGVKAAAVCGIIETSDELNLPLEVEPVVAAMDLGLTAAKCAYKVAVGESGVTDALEAIADRAVCAAVGVVRAMAPRVGAAAGGAIGAALGQMVGMAPLGMSVGRKIGAIAGHAVAEAVHSGLNSLRQIARQSARTLGEKVSQGVRFLAGLFA